ncbi:D-alanine--D-alanine ligase [Bifidobacterium tsurumiense]|uniref:D-alanine--D-alanine ligase family protein n=1 Tax=Bifidobacterium tsurumiense TaxID=356829 RepID=UPI001E323B23|nr:D-alanine--D-alanine ligase [Bifidobacterium tsurumiense]
MADKDATSQDAAAQALADAAQAGNTDLSSETSHAIDAAYKENMASSIKSSTKIELKARKDTTVLIICGGLSHERDISLSSGHRVGGFLEDAGWHVVFHDMDSDLIEYLNNPNTCPDIVWPLLHGANGEDGSIRDVLEMVGLPYIGSRAKASRTAWSKPIAKNVVRKLGGLNTPHSVTLPESMFRELGAGKVIDLLVQSMGLPLFIKPTMGGSAMGCTLVTDAKQLPQAMVSCFAYGDVALVEQAVAGTEVSVSILDIDGEPLVLPPLEISTPNGTYDYDARYTPGPTDFYVPARLPQEILKAVQDAALAAHRTLSLRDISRTDFIVDADGIPQFLESNVTPGMTDTSLLPQAAVAAGYNLADLYSQLVESVLRQNRAEA